MDVAGLVFTLIGTLAGIAGAYFAWIAVRPKRRATHSGAPTPTGPQPMGGDVVPSVYDVFISYAHEEAELVRALADRLVRRGLRVAFDEVVMLPGKPVLHAVEQAIRESAHGLLVFSRSSLSSGWVTNEYYLLMQRSIETGRLFIPVLVHDVELPEFARTRFYCDLRESSDVILEERAESLTKALHNAP
jgi:hypothetical protein